MFDLCRKSARAEIRSAEEFDSIRKVLNGSGAIGVIKSMEAAMCATLGIAPGSLTMATMLADRRMFNRLRPDGLLGEVFVKGDSLFMLIPDAHRLLAWELRSHSSPTQIDQFLVDVESAVRSQLDGRRVRGMEFTWKDDKSAIGPRARMLRARELRASDNKLETHEANFNNMDLERSKLFAQSANRDFLLKLAKIGNKARSSDASSLLDGMPLDALMDMGIIRKEYLLVCKQDSRTICSIPDRARLEETIGSELRCTGCGRAFTDEIIQDIYAITPDARTLLNGSHWMTIWVSSCLIEAGVPIEKIKWSGVAGDDELDIIADIHGLKVFFELKDREFGLGDAYPFSFRVDRYGGDAGVVITMDAIAEEAQRFLDEQQHKANAFIQTIKGEANIPPRINALVGSLSKMAVQRAVVGAEDRFGIDVWPFLKEWMNRYG